MSYPTCTKAIVCYIEAHIRGEKLDYEELERRIGFSMAHIRDLFRKSTGIPLVQYVRERRVKHSAFELLHSEQNILEIAYKYGFSNPETYTRAFSKIVGCTPSHFRTLRPLVGKEELITGVYGLGLLSKKEQRSDIIMNKDIYRNNDSTILYGVPKVAHGTYGGNTPYPICLKACAEYLGEDLEYYDVMVSSAAAFRFVWNNEMWDMSNVDIYHTFEESEEIYHIGPNALGREFVFLGRGENTSREEFIAFIKQHIDEGYPCIAQGIIGPPEPCIITGYRKGGEELLGWNFFQNDPEFAADISIDESGYFVCNNWWENTDTQGVMCMGALKDEKFAVDVILKNAVRALEGRIDCGYSKGVLAYDAWKKALEVEKDFAVEGNYSLLFEKALCQMDAFGCLIDGRKSAAAYFTELAKTVAENCAVAENQAADRIRIYHEIADAFHRCVETIREMRSLFDSPDGFDGFMEKLADIKIRRKSCELIEVAKQADSEALDLLKTLI